MAGLDKTGGEDPLDRASATADTVSTGEEMKQDEKFRSIAEIEIPSATRILRAASHAAEWEGRTLGCSPTPMASWLWNFILSNAVL